MKKASKKTMRNYPECLREIEPQLRELDRKIKKLENYRDQSSNHKEFSYWNKMIIGYKLDHMRATKQQSQKYYDRKQSA